MLQPHLKLPSVTGIRGEGPHRNASPLLCAVALALVALCAAGQPSAGRIVAPRASAAPRSIGGSDAAPGAWPWQVAVLDSARLPERRVLCGGALLAPDWVITTVACTVDYTGSTVRTYSSREIVAGVGLQRLSDNEFGAVLPVAEILRPADFNLSDGDYGAPALLRLARALPLGPGVQAIEPVAQMDDPALGPDRPVTFTGWGGDFDGPSDVLQQGELRWVEPAACGPKTGVLCARRDGVSPCGPDYGGPMVVPAVDGKGWRLAALLGSTRNGCLPRDNPVSATSLPRYLTSIREAMAGRRPALEIDKRAPGIVGHGNVFTYTLTVRNVGRAPATGIVVRDTMPAGVELVAAGQDGVLADGRLMWSVGELAGDSAREVAFSVREAAGSAQSERAAAAPSSGPSLPRPTDPGAAPLKAAPLPDIVGGSLAAPGAWPGHVAVMRGKPEGPEYLCGGTLVDPQWVLTAAHCTEIDEGQPLSLSVRLGSHALSDERAQEIPVARVFVNGQYHVDSWADMALLKLERAALLSDQVRPAALATEADLARLAPEFTGTVVGWGRLADGDGAPPDALRQVDLTVMAPGTCDLTARRPSAQSLAFCASEPTGRGVCSGDSGGPFMVRRADGSYVSAGVLSGGNSWCAGRPGDMAVFSRTSVQRDWIQRTMTSEIPDLVVRNVDFGATADGGLAATGRAVVTRITVAGARPLPPRALLYLPVLERPDTTPSGIRQ